FNIWLTYSLLSDERHRFHYNLSDVSKLSRNGMVEGFKLDSSAKPDPVCEPCFGGKMHANPFPVGGMIYTKFLELVHMDVHDTGVVSPSGYRYWIPFI
ncbi:hypothetical protein BDP27DRAFT_1160545, partial [Rhodocollybia butyracea]